MDCAVFSFHHEPIVVLMVEQVWLVARETTMEKFGMSFGGGPSRKELLDTIESQKKQLGQYQSRFKDVVQAYKSLLKEKEALEASLKVLTVTQDQEQNQDAIIVRPDLADDGCSLHSEDSMDTAVSLDTPTDIRGDQSEEDQGDMGGKLNSTVRLNVWKTL